MSNEGINQGKKGREQRCRAFKFLLNIGDSQYIRQMAAVSFPPVPPGFGTPSLPPSPGGERGVSTCKESGPKKAPALPFRNLIGANLQQNQVQLSKSPFAKGDSGGFVLADKVKSPPPPFTKGGEFVELQINTNQDCLYGSTVLSALKRHRHRAPPLPGCRRPYPSAGPCRGRVRHRR